MPSHAASNPNAIEFAKGAEDDADAILRTDGALVRALSGVDAVTFARVLAVAAEMSARTATPAALAAHPTSRRGGK